MSRTIPEKPYLQQIFRKKLLNLCQPKNEKVLISNFKSTLRKFCNCSKVDPFQYDLRFGLNYWAILFQQILDYDTISIHKAAILAYHKKLDSLPINE